MKLTHFSTIELDAMNYENGEFVKTGKRIQLPMSFWTGFQNYPGPMEIWRNLEEADLNPKKIKLGTVGWFKRFARAFVLSKQTVA